MKTNRSFPVLIFFVILVIGFALAFVAYQGRSDVAAVGILVVTFLLASFVSSAIQVADQWSKAVVLRLGKFRSLEGPGLFLIVPLIETIPYWIDTRVLTSSFTAEKTLTKDTVPVDVDAVLFWKIVDPKKSCPRCRRLSERNQLGIANRSARCNWQDHALRHVGRQRQN